MDTIGNVLLCAINGIFIALLIYVAVWTPKERMKGHSGRSKCRCCSKNKTKIMKENPLLRWIELLAWFGVILGMLLLGAHVITKFAHH